MSVLVALCPVIGGVGQEVECELVDTTFAIQLCSRTQNANPGAASTFAVPFLS
jgi:hypothetical protein